MYFRQKEARPVVRVRIRGSIVHIRRKQTADRAIIPPAAASEHPPCVVPPYIEESES